MKARAGGKIESNFPPLFQAIRVPKKVPIANEIINEVPAKNIVQSRPEAITFVTGSGK